MAINKIEFITNYLCENYKDDVERLVRIPIIAAMAMHATEGEIPSLIDKVALMNGIKKSYSQKEIIINA